MGFDIVDSWEQQQKERIEEIKRNIWNSYPSRNGLKIPEIMVLYYARTFKTNQTEFQRFWYYEYAVENPQKVLKSLLNKGFICMASAEESLKNFKLPELKEMLKELGLKQSGKKVELIQRILENADKSYIDKKVTCRNYDLTDLGRQELSENEYVPYFHKQKSRYGVDVFWMNQQIHTYPDRNFRDLIWGELNRQTQEAMKELSAGNAYPYIWNRRQMCDFLLDENRNFEHALNLIAEADYYEVNVKLPNTYRVIFFENDRMITSIYHIATESYKKIKAELNLSDDDFFQKLTGFFSRFHTENPIISDSDLAGLIVSEINEDTVTTEIVYRQMETKLREISRKNQAYQYKNQEKKSFISSIKSIFGLK